MKTLIIVKTSFNAIHYWPGCNVPGVEYLKNKHRHTFYVKVKILVGHDDREIEFIDFKKQLDHFLQTFYQEKDLDEKSCEMLCKEIFEKFSFLSYLRVMEDDENGAEFII